MVAFTHQLNDPRLGYDRSVASVENTEVNTSVGDALSNMSVLINQGTSLFSEISMDKIASVATTSIENIQTQFAEAEVGKNPGYIKEVQDKLGLVGKIPNSTIRHLKLQDLRNQLYRENTSKKARATIDAAFLKTTGRVSPSQAMAAASDTREQAIRQAEITKVASRIKTARASGHTGTDAEVLHAADQMALNGATLRAISSAGAAAGGGNISATVFRSPLVGKFQVGREVSLKVGMLSVLPLLQEFDTASDARKAQIRTLLGNEINNLKINLLKQFGPDASGMKGKSLSKAELDYMVEPAIRIMNMIGRDMGLIPGELTEEEALKQLNTSRETAVKTIQNTVFGDVFNIEAVQEVWIAKQIGGELLAQQIGKIVPQWKSLVETHMQTSDAAPILANTLKLLVSGGELPKDKTVAQLNQKAGLDIISLLNTDAKGVSKAHSSGMLDIVANGARMVVSGDAHLATSKNLEKSLDQMSSANGLEWTRKLYKEKPGEAANLINFYNKNAHASLTQRMTELAQIVAADKSIGVTRKNGKFVISGASNTANLYYNDAVNAADDVNIRMERLLKFKEWSKLDKDKASPVIAQEISDTLWPSMWDVVSNKPDKKWIEFSLTPKQYLESDAYLTIGKPYFSMNDEERKKWEIMFKKEYNRFGTRIKSSDEIRKVNFVPYKRVD